LKPTTKAHARRVKAGGIVRQYRAEDTESVKRHAEDPKPVRTTPGSTTQGVVQLNFYMADTRNKPPFSRKFSLPESDSISSEDWKTTRLRKVSAPEISGLETTELDKHTLLVASSTSNGSSNKGVKNPKYKQAPSWNNGSLTQSDAEQGRIAGNGEGYRTGNTDLSKRRRSGKKRPVRMPLASTAKGHLERTNASVQALNRPATTEEQLTSSLPTVQPQTSQRPRRTNSRRTHKPLYRTHIMAPLVRRQWAPSLVQHRERNQYMAFNPSDVYMSDSAQHIIHDSGHLLVDREGVEEKEFVRFHKILRLLDDSTPHIGPSPVRMVTTDDDEDHLNEIYHRNGLNDLEAAVRELTLESMVRTGFLTSNADDANLTDKRLPKQDATPSRTHYVPLSKQASNAQTSEDDSRSTSKRPAIMRRATEDRLLEIFGDPANEHKITNDALNFCLRFFLASYNPSRKLSSIRRIYNRLQQRSFEFTALNFHLFLAVAEKAQGVQWFLYILQEMIRHGFKPTSRTWFNTHRLACKRLPTLVMQVEQLLHDKGFYTDPTLAERFESNKHRFFRPNSSIRGAEG
jgi:hypothetical protein